MPEKSTHWYVVYTKPRWEKKVYSLLTEMGMDAYCPLNRVRKKWSDRQKWVQEPLFKSYVFVKVTEGEQPKVRTINGVVNFVYWLGRPAIIKEKEIEIVRKFLNEYDDVQAIPYNLKRDTHITIINGIFMDKEARVMKVFNGKVQVIIDSIGYSLVAVLNRSNVAITGNS
jgi:transcription antitermination factor NusG